MKESPGIGLTSHDDPDRRSALEDEIVQRAVVEVFRGVERLQRHSPPCEACVIKVKLEAIETGIPASLVERAVNQEIPLT